jgi:hypothetical protein
MLDFMRHKSGYIDVGIRTAIEIKDVEDLTLSSCKLFVENIPKQKHSLSGKEAFGRRTSFIRHDTKPACGRILPKADMHSSNKC